MNYPLGSNNSSKFAQSQFWCLKLEVMIHLHFYLQSSDTINSICGFGQQQSYEILFPASTMMMTNSIYARCVEIFVHMQD